MLVAVEWNDVSSMAVTASIACAGVLWLGRRVRKIVEGVVTGIIEVHTLGEEQRGRDALEAVQALTVEIHSFRTILADVADQQTEHERTVAERFRELGHGAPLRSVE